MGLVALLGILYNNKTPSTVHAYALHLLSKHVKSVFWGTKYMGSRKDKKGLYTFGLHSDYTHTKTNVSRNFICFFLIFTLYATVYAKSAVKVVWRTALASVSALHRIKMEAA
jgi:hypothetical protein